MGVRGAGTAGRLLGRIRVTTSKQRTVVRRFCPPASCECAREAAGSYSRSLPSPRARHPTSSMIIRSCCRFASFPSHTSSHELRYSCCPVVCGCWGLTTVAKSGMMLGGENRIEGWGSRVARARTYGGGGGGLNGRRW
ncbi:hypothetical protein GALMADRAFT_452157 [Galerina marginata CBS 339.88]|uniref:Uncharacterized protein n=1 Tax=Galerina marginata (strain CBS 339.88) TaxID=685588 RepID=A0A067TC92_GALM3|nr:hypothetical protein GALMADRAFT_452157 [Galerina marginata CBS 339.88]